MLLGVISQCGSSSCTLQKRPSSLLQLGQQEITPEHSIESRAYWFFFENYRVFPIPTGRVGIGWWPLPQVRDSLEDKSMIVYSKKTFSPFSLSRNRIYLGTHLKDELTDLFWKLPRYSLFPHRQSCKSRQRMMNTLLMVNINLTCNR